MSVTAQPMGAPIMAPPTLTANNDDGKVPNDGKGAAGHLLSASTPTTDLIEQIMHDAALRVDSGPKAASTSVLTTETELAFLLEVQTRTVAHHISHLSGTPSSLTLPLSGNHVRLADIINNNILAKYAQQIKDAAAKPGQHIDYMVRKYKEVQEKKAAAIKAAKEAIMKSNCAIKLGTVAQNFG